MSKKRSDKIRYLRAAADHWREAILVQERRCRNQNSDSVGRIDLNFYVVAVVRLRNIAIRARDVLRLDSVRGPIEKFDKRWPRLTKLRDEEEHFNQVGKKSTLGSYPLGILKNQSSILSREVMLSTSLNWTRCEEI